jgi:hypothetical protein
MESLFPLAHPVTAVVLTTEVKEMHCTIKYTEMVKPYDIVG